VISCDSISVRQVTRLGAPLTTEPAAKPTPLRISFESEDSRDYVLSNTNKKLSYSRETARQLPIWRGREVRTLQPTPPPLPLVTSMRMVESETRNKRTSSVPSNKRTLKMNRAFKVIEGHLYWCRQKSRTVCCNVQLMPTLFLKLTKIMATGKRQIRRFQRPHSSLKTSQQEMPSYIYKWFILPETRIFEHLHFCRR